MNARSLSDWLTRIEALHPREIELGLARVRAVQASMGLDAPGFAVITVAGTNGKGSTVAMLEAMLGAAGYRVGAYTSPHLVRYNERVRLNGHEASDEALCQGFEQVEAARGETSLTYFEFGTLAALALFHSAGIEIAVLEVGLGGRLDAVNCLDADVAVVTAIGIDHVDWLGADRESIGREKAGIFRGGRPAICADPTPPASIADQAGQSGPGLIHNGRDFFAEQVTDTAWAWRLGDHRRSGLPLPAMRGRYQLFNAAAALSALHMLEDRFPVTQQDIRAGLLQAVVPGRFQVLPGRPLRVLDVAHNPQAVSMLGETLDGLSRSGRTLAVVAMLKDKAVTESLTCLTPRVDAWYVAGLALPRGADAAHMRTALQEAMTQARVDAPIEVFDSVVSAYQAALQAARETDCIVVFGSFHTVGDILRM